MPSITLAIASIRETPLTPTLSESSESQTPTTERSALVKANTVIPMKKEVPGKNIRFNSNIDFSGTARRSRKLGCGPLSLPLELRLKRFYDRLETFARESATHEQPVSRSALSYKRMYTFVAETPKEHRVEDAENVFKALGSMATGGTHYVKRGAIVRKWFLAHDAPSVHFVLQNTAAILQEVACKLELPPDVIHPDPYHRPSSCLDEPVLSFNK